MIPLQAANIHIFRKNIEKIHRMHQANRTPQLIEVLNQRLQHRHIAAVCVNHLIILIQNHRAITAHKVVTAKILLQMQIPDAVDMAAADQRKYIACLAPIFNSLPLCIVNTVVIECSVIIAANNLHG